MQFEGDIIVADSQNNRIQVFDRNGKRGEEDDDGLFNEPFGVVVDRQGNCAVTDSGNNRVQIFNPAGQFVRKFGSNVKWEYCGR